jgi:nitric oxide reductase large subunit
MEVKETKTMQAYTASKEKMKQLAKEAGLIEFGDTEADILEKILQDYEKLLKKNTIKK